jgi:hypothetical protein
MHRKTLACALIAACSLLVACTGTDGGLVAGKSEASPAFGVSEPAASASTIQACDESISWTVSTPTGDPVAYPIGTPLTLAVGDRMVLSAAPGCQMSFTAQKVGSDVLKPTHETSAAFLAIAPGQARVKAYHAMCDGSSVPDCLGGVAILPEVIVRVTG